MKQYDVKCPVCGTMNKGLFLDETGGWLECDHCHSVTQNGDYMRLRTKRIPLFTMGQRLQFPAQGAV